MGASANDRAGLITPVILSGGSGTRLWPMSRALYPILDNFDELVLSGDVGLVKPDAAIFDLLVRRRNLEVERTVFIDDSADNVTTADRLGFATIHFNEHTTDLCTELLRLGLPLEAISDKLR